MDFKTYDKMYEEILSKKGLVDISEQPEKEKELVDKINKFLDLYPKSIRKDKDPNAKIYQISIKELFRRFLQTAIDILNDISRVITKREYISSSTFRRELFKVFTRIDRRLYVGLWIMFFAFVLYFIDSAA
jgi:hypothetical protein